MQKGIPSKLINLVKNHGYKFPSLQIVVPTGQKYSPAFKMEIMEQLKSVPLVSPRFMNIYTLPIDLTLK